MKEYLPFIIFGIASGSIYGLSAMGLVLTYKTSGLFNFGHGALSALAAFLFYTLHDEEGMAWPLAAIISVLVFGLVAGLCFERFAAALAGVSSTLRIVGTVGVFVGVRALISLTWGEQGRVFNPFLPQDTVFSVSGVSVTVETVIIFLLGAVSGVALFGMFRYTRVGRSMRAVVDDPTLLDTTGDSPSRVRRLSWIVGTSFAAISGVLFAEVQQQLQVDVLSLLIVQAFGAAALARFTSLPLSFVGGLGVGIVQKLVSKEAASHASLANLDINVPFIILLIVLVSAKPGILKELGRTIKPRAVRASRLSGGQQAGTYVAAGVLIAAIPLFVGSHLPLWNTAMAEVTLCLSLSLLVRLSGQISLCQFGFAAIGAAAFGHLVGDGWPWGLALIGAGLITLPVGALIAIPAIRLSGLYLGLATLGFGIMLQQFFYGKSYMFGVQEPLHTPRPSFAHSDKNYFYLLLATSILAAAVVIVVERSRLGRLLRGLSDAPLALTTLGADTRVTLVLIFSLASAMAGVSGALFASLFGQIGGYSFQAPQSLVILAVFFASGRGLIVPAFVAPALLYVLPGYISDGDVTLGIQVAFGVVAFLVAALSQVDVGARLASWAARDSDRKVGPTARSLNVYRPRSQANFLTPAMRSRS